MSTLETLISWGDHLRLGTIQHSDVPEAIVSDARSLRPRDIQTYIESHPATRRVAPGDCERYELPGDRELRALLWKLDLYSSLLTLSGGTGYEHLDRVTPASVGIEKPEGVLKHLARLPYQPVDVAPTMHWLNFDRYFDEDEDDGNAEDEDFFLRPVGRAIVSCVPTAWIWKVWPLIPATKACGFAFCSASSDMSDNLTFGSGILHPSGYWSHPCTVCEEAWLSKHGSTHPDKWVTP